MEYVEDIKKLFITILSKEGAELVELTYCRRKEGMVLTLLVDKPSGITLDECSRLNRLLGQALDDTDAIKESYILEVSSPGLDRPLRNKNDFIRSVGKLLRINTNSEINGKTKHQGRLYGVNEQEIVLINRDNRATVIPFSDILKARLEIKF